MSQPKVITDIVIPDRHDSTPVHLSDTVTFQWLYNGKAYIIEVHDSRRDTIDLYINTTLKILDEWDRNTRFYSLQDISHKEFQMTPYLKGRLDDVLNRVKNSGVEGYSIIVMSDGFTGRIMQVLGRFFAQQSNPIKQVWVTNRQAGEEKLAQIIADPV